LYSPHAVLYIHLFYTEEFWGWNKEHWKIYLTWSVAVAGTVLAGLLVARSRTPGLRGHITITIIILIGGVIMPLSILPYFMAGKPTVQPLPAGVNAMNNFGCC
jgi:phosphatidylserine synthase